MSLLPKQLQKFTDTSIATGPGGTKVRNYSFGDHVVLNDGLVPVTDYTVNTLLRFMEEDYTEYVTTIDYTKSEDRFRPFDGDFGDEVVFPSGVAISGDQVVNEIIEILRVLWEIRATRTVNKTGKATSVQN